jgi:hypothetical protein
MLGGLAVVLLSPALAEAARPAWASRMQGGRSDPANALRAARDALSADRICSVKRPGAILTGNVLARPLRKQRLGRLSGDPGSHA